MKVLIIEHTSAIFGGAKIVLVLHNGLIAFNLKKNHRLIIIHILFLIVGRMDESLELPTPLPNFPLGNLAPEDNDEGSSDEEDGRLDWTKLL